MSKRETREASGLLRITVINKTKAACSYACAERGHFADSFRVCARARACCVRARRPTQHDDDDDGRGRGDDEQSSPCMYANATL